MSDERVKEPRRFHWKAVAACVVLLLMVAAGVTMSWLGSPWTAAGKAAAQVAKEEYAAPIDASIVESSMKQECGQLKSTDVQSVFDQDKPAWIVSYSDKPGGTPQAMADLHDEALEIQAALATICPQYKGKDGGSVQRMLDATAHVKVVDRTPEQIVRDNVPMWANESNAGMDALMHSICATMSSYGGEEEAFNKYMSEGLTHNQVRITALQSADAFCTDEGSDLYSPDGTDTSDVTGSTDDGSSTTGNSSSGTSGSGSYENPTPAPPDRDFVATLVNSDSSFGQIPASTLITVAHEACSSLESGSTPQGVGEVGMVAGLTERQSAEFVGAAIAAYCPMFADHVH